MSTATRKIAFCKVSPGLMFYLELQHGPSYIGVEQQTVGSYTGARITCVFNRDLNRASIHVRLNTLLLCHCYSLKWLILCRRWLTLTALSVSACCKLWVMNWALMRRHGSSFTSEFIRATRAASLRASAWVPHTWGWETMNTKAWNVTKSGQREQKDVKLSHSARWYLLSLGLNHFEPMSSVFKQAPTLSSILTILHFITANHGIRTQITNEIRTLEVFTNNQSHASCELGAAVWVTMSPLMGIVEFERNDTNLKQP